MKNKELKYVVYNDELFKHMQDEHDLLLLHGEMYEIEIICNRQLKEKINQTIKNLEDKKNSWLGQDGEKMRQQFKDGLDWAIDSFKDLANDY